MADEEKAEAAATPAKKSKLPLIISAVVLLAGAGAASWYLGVFRGEGEELHGEAGAAVEDGHGESHGSADDGHGGGGHGGAKAPGPIKPFEPFIANLAARAGRRHSLSHGDRRVFPVRPGAAARFSSARLRHSVRPTATHPFHDLEASS